MKTLLGFQLRPIELSDEPSSDDPADINNEEEEISDTVDPFEIVARHEARIGCPLFFATKEDY